MFRKWFLRLCLAALCLPAAADDFTFAGRVLDFVKSEHGDSICALLHPSLQGRVTAAAFSGVFARLSAQFGPLSAEGEWTTEQVQGYRKDCRRLTFGRTPLLFTLVTDSASHIMAITFTPAPDEPAPTAAKDSFTEREVTVENGLVRLPGTLCLPAAMQGRVPVVVLVHGSGPNDRDETLGPNKPFRELAHRLAAHGVATLRYDKRTYAYADRLASVFPEMNYNTETVDDAVAALSLAAAQPEADTARIFVLGHSLGGGLAPHIARRSVVPLAGIVVMAGMARPIDEALREQLRYIVHDVNGMSYAMADSLYEETLSALPASYLQAARRYDGPGEARQLRLPMLFLQGGHDYQATRADFDRWQEALQGRADARFVWLPSCDHLLRELPAMAVPEDYLRALPMSAEAIAAVAAFVTAR